MFLFIVSKFKTKINFKDKKLLFLIIINIVPIILVFLTSLFLGAKIRTMWMTPFYLFYGVLFIYIFQKQVDFKKFKYFFSIFLLLFIFSPALYFYISVTETNKRTDYPGKEISKLVEQEWKKINNNKKKINHVIGWDEWYAGNLSYNIGGRVLFENFVDELFKTKDNNYILITKSDKAKQVCELDALTDLYLVNYLLTYEHHICFMTNLKSINNGSIIFLFCSILNSFNSTKLDSSLYFFISIIFFVNIIIKKTIDN